MASPRNRRTGDREPDFATPMYENDPRDPNAAVEEIPVIGGSSPDPLGLLRDSERREKSDE